MRMKLPGVIWAAIVLSLSAAPLITAAERPTLGDLGRSVKMRILVDKVMQPTRGWKTEEWMVQETAKAGFNVFSPRRGAEDIGEVRKVTEWCRKAGLYHQPWMRGAEGVPKDMSLSAGRRLVWADGSEQALWSPNSDELWQWLAGHILPYAEISAQDDTLMGVFLDYENYWPGGRGNLYELSYDDVIMGKFAANKGIELPPLALDKRKAWLDEKALHDEFRSFQISHWRQKCRELRQAVDRISPKFVFNIYPAPGTMFMLEACYPEWATAAAPLLLADPWTYGRFGRFAEHETALRNNQAIIERGKATAQAKDINHIYLGGIDPAVTGADPEFSGKNALLLTGLTGGYWIFYEGPVYAKNHQEYFKWFSWANQRIEVKDFAAAWLPRETDDPWGLPKIRVSGQPLPRTGKREFPALSLRGANVLLAAGHKNVPVQVTVQVSRVGRNEDPLRWAVKAAEWSDVGRGEIAVGGVGSIAFTPSADGICVMLLEAGGNAYTVKDATVALAIYTDPEARFIHVVPKLYVRVPPGLSKMVISAHGGSGVETVRLTVFDPAGTVVAAQDASERQNRISVTVPTGDDAGKVWALSLDKADAGVLEDSGVILDPALPRVLSFFADEIFDTETTRLK
jgi:hypothetical protein